MGKINVTGKNTQNKPKNNQPFNDPCSENGGFESLKFTLKLCKFEENVKNNPQICYYKKHGLFHR